MNLHTSELSNSLFVECDSQNRLRYGFINQNAVPHNIILKVIKSETL